jgi:hypothetical protein
MPRIQKGEMMVAPTNDGGKIGYSHTKELN